LRGLIKRGKTVESNPHCIILIGKMVIKLSEDIPLEYVVLYRSTAETG
jgi:hypothetical protein